MTKFKKQFIVLDGTQENLARAIEKAKEMGYREYMWGLTRVTKEKNILRLNEDGSYYLTYWTKEKLIEKGHTELTLEPNVHYVYVSDKSVEDALKQKEKRILVADLGEQFRNRYITVLKQNTETYLKGENNIGSNEWKYIAEIPKEAPNNNDEILNKIESLEKQVKELERENKNLKMKIDTLNLDLDARTQPLACDGSEGFKHGNY